MNIEFFKPKHRLYRGNLHGHSQHSDGALDSAAVVKIYQDLGYDFTCLSDHLWSDQRFCAQTVNPYAYADDRDFITIPSAEIHCRGKKYDQSGLWHIVANGLPVDFAMADDHETAPELVQRAIDAGAFVSIAHPEWYVMTSDEALSVAHAHAVEIYNHSCAIEANRGSGVYVADLLLNQGFHTKIIATDDSHFRLPDAGGGWVMVAADTLNPRAIIGALKAGQFYATTGPDIHQIALCDNIVTVTCSAVDMICLAGQGNLALYKNGKNTTCGQFDISEFSSDWFRLAITDAAGRSAWSNPYWPADYC